MKFLYLLPLFLLTINFSGSPAPAKPQAVVSGYAGIPKKAAVSADEEIIPWKPERLLVWDDFLCAPQQQGDAVASTSTSLGIAYQLKNSKLSYKITCHFSKHKSWGSLKTEYILAHEQAHFDITELHARKLYAALYNYEYKPSTFKKDIAAIYERIVKEKEEMQEAYDGETDHSRKRRVQYEWLDKIDAMLEETEMFAVYP
ncbi:MAG TPA: DUF922 domain-containing protein [Flavisolibacter sp.]|jgi:hypothetical protein|nr:DUF922 domain-containing protein [Flavisolibacter sp.]